MEIPTPQQEQPAAKPSKSKLPGPIALVKEAWAVYKKRYLEFSALALPFILSEFARASLQDAVKNHQAVDVSTLYLLVFTSFLAYLISIIIFILLLQDNKLSIAVAFGKAVRKIIPFLGLSIVYGICVFVGFLLLIIPGIYVYVMFGFAAYIYLIEGTSISESFERSKNYVSARWWQIYGRMVFISITQFLLLIIASIIVAAFGFLWQINSTLLSGVIVGVMNFIYEPLSVIYSYLLYKHARETYIASHISPQQENPIVQQ